MGLRKNVLTEDDKQHDFFILPQQEYTMGGKYLIPTTESKSFFAQPAVKEHSQT